MTKGSEEISNSEDVIDSRNVIDRIAYLESERDELQSTINDAETDEDKDTAIHELEEWDNADELAALLSLAEEADCCGSWQDGETLIRRSYFSKYCEELLKNVGDLLRDIPWYIVIDWEATADNLKADYMTVDFDGVDYLIRQS